MKTAFLAFTLALSLNAHAATSYVGVIDVMDASNKAKIPTVINAGAYTYEVKVEASPESTEVVSLNRSVFRDDGDYVCTINGSFKVGVATITLKGLLSDWTSTTVQDVYAAFETTTNDRECAINSSAFEGQKDFTIAPVGVTLELPVKDARFSSVKLAVKPLVDGFAVSYDLVKDLNGSLKVNNAGLIFNQALEESSDKTTAYALSLTAGGYYHFDTEYTTARKLTK